MSKDPTPKPSHLNGATDAFDDQDLRWILSRFRIGTPESVFLFPRRGNINLHTYEVHTAGGAYLLQKINPVVFVDPTRVVRAELAAISAQRESLANHPVPGWRHIELIDTIDGEPCLDLSDERGRSIWRLMVYIERSVAYKSLGEIPERAGQLALAEETGRGLAIYSKLTSSIEAGDVEPSLPGYRDTALYYDEMKSVLRGHRTVEEVEGLVPADPALRQSVQRLFLVACPPEEHRRRMADPEVAAAVRLALEHEELAVSIWSALREGRIRKTLIHGDPKIENFLFDADTGAVKALVDLDTIMAFTWLNDYGDMIRSLVNVAGEKEPDLSKIVIDEEVFGAVTRGFVRSFEGITEQDRALMVPAAFSAILELAVRFVADWLRGDAYFRLGPKDPPELNRTRALVQFRLFERMLAFAPRAEALLRDV